MHRKLCECCFGCRERQRKTKEVSCQESRRSIGMERANFLTNFSCRRSKLATISRSSSFAEKILQLLRRLGSKNVTRSFSYKKVVRYTYNIIFSFFCLFILKQFCQNFPIVADIILPLVRKNSTNHDTLLYRTHTQALFQLSFYSTFIFLCLLQLFSRCF